MEQLQFHMDSHTWFLQDQWMLLQFSMRMFRKLMDLEIRIHSKSFYRQFIIRQKYVMNLRKQICKLGSCLTIHITHKLVKVIMQFSWMAYPDLRLTTYLHQTHGRLQRLCYRQIYMIVSHWVLQLTILQIMQCLQEFNGSCLYHWFHKYLWYKMMNYGIIIHFHKCQKKLYWQLEMHHWQNWSVVYILENQIIWMDFKVLVPWIH